jgi:hypothetical protein
MIASTPQRAEATGATCDILDPMRLRTITDFWNKTDRRDARNTAKALWVFLVTGPARPFIRHRRADIGGVVETGVLRPATPRRQ